MRKNLAAYPYTCWMLIFIVVPLVLVLYYSIVDWQGGVFRLTTQHLQRVFEPIYLNVIWRSVRLALVSTAICLGLGYPMALILSSRHLSRNNLLVVLFIVPMWMNFLARTYAWMTLLEKNGMINKGLEWLHLPAVNILYTDYAVILGMVYNFLPFMVLPIYSVLQKIDRDVIEAAEDLGATPLTTFRRVVFPLSIPGVLSGIMMVFMPAVTTFVISRLLGGGQYTLIGNLIEQQYLSTGDWGFGSALSLVLMVMILFSIGLMSRYAKESEGGGLW